VGQQLGGGDRVGHARRGGRVLLSVGNDEDNCADLWPVRLRSDLLGDGVGPVFLLAPHAPCDESTIEGAAGRAGSLPGNGGQLPRIRLLCVEELGESSDEGGVSGRRAGKPRRGGEGVVAGDMNLHAGPLVPFHDYSSGRGIYPILREAADPVDAGAKALRRRGALLLGAVEPEPIGLERLGRRRSGDSAQVGLVEGDRDGAIDRGIVLDRGLAPVFDASNVGRGRDCLHEDRRFPGRSHDMEAEAQGERPVCEGFGRASFGCPEGVKRRWGE